MEEIKSLDGIYLALAFLTPGLIALWIRAQFTTGRIPSVREGALAYLTVSVIYYAIAFPAVEAALKIQAPGWNKALAWLGLVIIGPAAFGFLLGLLAKWQPIRRMIRHFGINPVHEIPTAWDWQFGRISSQIVLVTLTDGT